MQKCSHAQFYFQVGYFVGGVASLESSEIAGLAVTFSVVAVLVLALLLVFFVRQRMCGGSGGPGAGGGGGGGGFSTFVVRAKGAAANGQVVSNGKHHANGGDAGVTQVIKIVN